MSVTVLSYPSSDSDSTYDDGSSTQPASPGGSRARDGEISPSLRKQHRRTWLDFDAAFPSIIKTAMRLRDARDDNTLQAFIAIAEVFVTCARTAIHEVHRSCVDAPTDGSYDLAKSAAELVISLMQGKIKTDVTDLSAVDLVLDLADMLIANLKELTKIALRITREQKPLPALPYHRTSEVDESNDKKFVAENRLSFFDYELVDSDVYEESYDLPRHKFLFGNKLRYVLKSTHSGASSELLSSEVTVVGNDSQSAISCSTVVKGRDLRAPSDVPSVLRQSTYLVPPDAVPFQLEIEASSPRDDRKSLCLDEDGEVKAASISALVRMLTSMEVVLDPDLEPTFFAGFRVFGSAGVFLKKLKQRFDEEAPHNLDAIQLRVWTREAFLTRLRVGKILLLWLTDYWQPEYDDEILGHLHQFAVERIRNELPRSLATPILEMIDSRMTGDEVYVTSHKDRYFKILASQVAQTKIAVTGFSFPDALNGDTDSILALFDTEVGKEEFTRQLTAIASAMFRKIKPQDVVLYWHKNSDSQLGPALWETTNFARSFAMFVTHSIITQEERILRCRRIEFWITIATSCLHHRNYFVSHVIFTGTTHSAVNRLKRTILELSQQAKIQFRRLDQFFSGHLNHANVRKAMAEKTAATIPLLVPLKQDIVGLKHVPPMIQSGDAAGGKTLVNLVPYRVLMKTMRAMESSLIPYGFPKNAKFEGWLKEMIKRFPVDEENKSCNLFYEESRRIEPRDKELECFDNTWAFCEVVRHKKKIIQNLPPDEELSNHQTTPRKGKAKPFKTLLESLMGK